MYLYIWAGSGWDTVRRAGVQFQLDADLNVFARAWYKLLDDMLLHAGTLVTVYVSNVIDSAGTFIGEQVYADIGAGTVTLMCFCCVFVCA